MSHSIWVRGLKQAGSQLLKLEMLSHSIWVRGLKPVINVKEDIDKRRTLYGCVD